MDRLGKHYREATARIELKLSIPKNFLSDLEKEDDWGVIIKSHACLEVICNQTLSGYFPNSLENFLVEMPFWGKPSKVEMLHSLGIIEQEDRKFLKYLSELRNKLAHDTRFLSFDIAKYFEGLDRNQKKQWSSLLTFYFGLTTADSAFKDNPKSVIIDMVRANIGLISLHDDLKRKDIEYEEKVKKSVNTLHSHIVALESFLNIEQ